MEKVGKVKIPFHSIDFAAMELLQRQSTPSQEQGEWHHQALPQGLHSASQHHTTLILNCVCEHLCSISVYFVHLFARCVLRYLLLCFMPFQLMKAFIGTLHFQRARKPVFSWSLDKDCPRRRHDFGQGSSLQLRVILGTWLRTISCPHSQQLGNNRCLRHAGETGPHLTTDPL